MSYEILCPHCYGNQFIAAHVCAFIGVQHELSRKSTQATQAVVAA